MRMKKLTEIEVFQQHLASMSADHARRAREHARTAEVMCKLATRKLDTWVRADKLDLEQGKHYIIRRRHEAKQCRNDPVPWAIAAADEFGRFNEVYGRTIPTAVSGMPFEVLV